MATENMKSSKFKDIYFRNQTLKQVNANLSLFYSTYVI